jgi:hypothetical protein
MSSQCDLHILSYNNDFFSSGATQPIVGVYFTALYRALASSRTRLLDHIQRRGIIIMTIIPLFITILLLTGSLPLKAVVFVVLFGNFSPNIIHITISFLCRLHTKKGYISCQCMIL